jgi:imidazole glycerol-phosphate synthase subunit HisH
MKRVTVVDYGMGNLLSVSQALEEAGGSVTVAHSAEQILEAERLVLPGVGAFVGGMAELHERGFVEPIREFAASGRPLLGICLGMQMLLDRSEEFGESEGLGLIPGSVVPVPAAGTNGAPHKIPHIGWNELVRPEGGADWDDSILRNVAPGSSAYFVHSFTAAPEDPRHRLADCHYDGCTISAALRSGNLYGTQFHPERSGPAGIRVIDAFLDL